MKPFVNTIENQPGEAGAAPRCPGSIKIVEMLKSTRMHENAQNSPRIPKTHQNPVKTPEIHKHVETRRQNMLHYSQAVVKSSSEEFARPWRGPRHAGDRAGGGGVGRGLGGHTGDRATFKHVFKWI